MKNRRILFQRVEGWQLQLSSPPPNRSLLGRTIDATTAALIFLERHLKEEEARCFDGELMLVARGGVGGAGPQFGSTGDVLLDRFLMFLFYCW
mmetsp:Transcript_5292/g.10090  ORF Transcript_5292/g.10090 Transcript_5292/m.10090 type:complete len:93 (-) Transcript_5292:144-422(-)